MNSWHFIYFIIFAESLVVPPGHHVLVDGGD